MIFGEPGIEGTKGTWKEVARLDRDQYETFNRSINALRKILIESHAAHFSISCQDLANLIQNAGDRLASGPIPGIGESSVSFIEHRITMHVIGMCSIVKFEQEKTLYRIESNFGKSSPEFKAARDAYSKLFDENFGYRYISKLRNIIHHDTIDFLSANIHAELTPEGPIGLADFRVERSVFLESSHCNQKLKNELEAMTEDPSMLEMALQATLGLRIITRNVRPLIDPEIETHCENVRNFEFLFQGNVGQRMIAEGEMTISNGKLTIPRFQHVDPEILEFAHQPPPPVPQLTFETIPSFSIASFRSKIAPLFATTHH